MISDFQDSPEFGQALPPIDPAAHPSDAVGLVGLPPLIDDATVDPLLDATVDPLLGGLELFSESRPCKLWLPRLNPGMPYPFAEDAE
jgi:hypothetical protein